MSCLPAPATLQTPARRLPPWPQPSSCTATSPPRSYNPTTHTVSLAHALPAGPCRPADTSAQAASLAATLKLHRHLTAGGGSSNGNGSSNGSGAQALTAAEEELFDDMGDIGLKPATVYHNLRWGAASCTLVSGKRIAVNLWLFEDRGVASFRGSPGTHWC